MGRRKKRTTERVSNFERDSIPGYRRIASPESITDNGAYELTAAILIQAHNDYVNALATLHNEKSIFDPVVKKYNKKMKWCEARGEYKKAKKIIPKQRKENQKLAIKKWYKVSKTPCPKISSKESTIYTKYKRLVRDVNDCESFYKSENYVIFTLGKGEHYSTLLPKLKAEAKKLWKTC